MNNEEYRRKVYGAWIGKAVGGTLGAPYEGFDGPLDLTFYDPVPTTMLPNDDLDLQVVWACRLATDWKGVIDRRNFEKAWRENIYFCFDEYGICIRNLQLGLHAPQTGEYDNAFTDGLGAAIRSELWACLAPGDPKLAAAYAYEDACLDHHGNGIYAEQFLAGLESYLFTDSDLGRAIEAGLSVIPRDSKLATAIRDTRKWCAELNDFWRVRERIMSVYGSDNFTDVTMNLSMEAAALLLCGDDLSKAICLAVNGGNDADCTGATVGAIMGIRDPGCIGEEWLKPIGTSLVLNKEITGLNPPADLDGFTDMVAGLRETVVLRPTVEEQPPVARRVNVRVCDFAPWCMKDFRKTPPAFDEKNAMTVALPGNYVTMDLSDLPANALRLVEMPFTLKETRDIKVVVNSPGVILAWLDGQLLFHRDGGMFVPAFHRTPANQSAVVKDAAAGKHTLLFGIRPTTATGPSVPVLFGIGDTASFWQPDAL